MATVDSLLHSLLFLSYIQYSEAYCYSYCWYTSWYIWFSVILIIAIGCGGLGSYCRRRQLQKNMRQQQAAMLTVTTGQQAQMQSDMSRPYVYNGTENPAYPITTGNTPYPAGTGNTPYPVGTAYPGPGAPPPGGLLMTPPAYTEEYGEKSGALPPSYLEAVNTSGYTNPVSAPPVSAPPSQPTTAQGRATYPAFK